MVLLNRGCANGIHMKHSATQINLTISRYLQKCLLVGLLVSLSFHVVDAASQGKLGTHSSASIEISVTVNQSLHTVSPKELILNSANKSAQTSMPFCIAHHGVNKNSSVPYELIVTSPATSSKGQQASLPYKIYLEDKNKNKQLLNDGTTVAQQSTLTINEEIVAQCSDNGQRLLIEKNNSIKKDVFSTASAGLMILLVSPN